MEAALKSVRRRCVAVSLVALAFMDSGTAVAQTTSGKVTGYIPHTSGTAQLFMFSLDSNLSGGCNVTGRFAITSNSLHFKGVQAGLMAAFHSQTPVYVIDGTTCNGWSNAWDVTAVCVGSIAC